MPHRRSWLRPRAALILLLLAPLAIGRDLRADTVVLKNGLIYRGTVDRDNTLLWVYDGLKRVVLRTTRVARIESDAAFRNTEVFQIKQPLVVHTGAMPKEVVRVDAGPWNDRGRRTFTYEGSRIGKPITMEQAINELGPHMVKYRGVDGFWLSQLSTSRVPMDVILGILGKVEQQDKNERIRVGRFLIQAEWYKEARAELDRILKDFPDDKELLDRVTQVRDSIVDLEAEKARASADRAFVARQPRLARTLLKSIPDQRISSALLEKVREARRADEAQVASDEGTIADLRALAEQVGSSDWKAATEEVLAALTDAPDAVRDRLLAWRKSRLDDPPPTEAQFALAMSGYVVGSDASIDDLDAAARLWKLRGLVRSYLAGADDAARSDALREMDAVAPPDEAGGPAGLKLIDTVTRIARLSVPPLHDAAALKNSKPRVHRVPDDRNAEPTDYVIALPPEYHPLRLYPTVVALHDGTGPDAAIAWWAAEASRRGYIVVAPEYRLSSQGKEYGYSASEHAAVELALRDARRRYSIDSDRVYLGGQLVGGNMAWDFGLAHPDLFAGVVIVSGLPFKYVGRYLAHARATKLPLYVVLGDLAPAGNEIVFNQILKPMISDALDVTYLEYLQRGLEDFPEEAPAALDWMERRRREPYPKSFEVLSARESDVRFFGAVIRDFHAGRTTAPGAVDPFGKNLRPATINLRSSSASNLISLQTTGVKRLDVWVNPTLFDFKRRLEVQVNRTTFFKGVPKPDLAGFLDDLRLRGDREQIYWLRVPAG